MNEANARTIIAANLSNETVQSFRRDGFVHVPGVISTEEAAEFRAAALDVVRRSPKYSEHAVFTQVINLWRLDPVMKRLTLHPNIGPIAEKLIGSPSAALARPRSHQATQKSEADRISPGQSLRTARQHPFAPYGLDCVVRRAGRARLHDFYSRRAPDD